MSAPRFDWKAAAKNAADSIDAAVIVTPDERAAADELTRELDTVYGVKHTEADWVRAGQILRDMPQRHIVHVQNELAQALAAERAAIHARYEAVAAELKKQALTFGDPADHAAELIRQVAAQ